MAISRHFFRSSTSQTLKILLSQPPHRFLSSDAVHSSDSPSHHNDHHRNHQYLSPSDYLGSWTPPKDPKEAQRKLAMLRREYGKKMKEVRKEYIQEMELQRLEKQRKDDAKKEALRIANEERKAAKTAMKKVKAAEREVAEKEFRETLLKERAQKFEYWKMRQQKIADKKKEKNELLRRQSSEWIDERELEKQIMNAVVDSNPL